VQGSNEVFQSIEKEKIQMSVSIEIAQISQSFDCTSRINCEVFIAITIASCQSNAVGS
jgi:hypothetical protein